MMRTPFNPEAGGWGAWQIAARYSWIDLQDSGMNGGEEQNVTAALTWHLFSNLSLNLSDVFLYSLERLWKRTKRKEGDDAGDREEQGHDCRQRGAATTGWALDGAGEGD
jgi:phosphate-selective porin